MWLDMIKKYKSDIYICILSVLLIGYHQNFTLFECTSMFVFMLIVYFYLLIPKNYSMLPLILFVTNVLILSYIFIEKYILYIVGQDYQIRLKAMDRKNVKF